MKKPADLTIEVLKSIRDEVKKTNTRLDALSADVNELRDSTSTRLDALREELSRRIVESELRTATAITELAGSVREMTATLIRGTSASLRV